MAGVGGWLHDTVSEGVGSGIVPGVCGLSSISAQRVMALETALSSLFGVRLRSS